MKMKKFFIVTAFLLVAAGMYADDANWLDAGFRAGGGFYPAGGIYVEGGEHLSPAGDFNLALCAKSQLIEWFAVKTEVMYVRKYLTVDMEYNVYKEDSSYQLTVDQLNIPLFADFSYAPNNFSFSGYGGVFLGLQLARNRTWTRGGETWNEAAEHNPVVFGVAAGLTAGYKLGPGKLFVDSRWSNDFEKKPNKTLSWGFFDFSLGYEVGLFKKNRDARVTGNKEQVVRNEE